MGTLGETDVIRNGNDVWLWRSANSSATHFKLPADKAGKADRKPTALPSGLPSTPQEAADAALAAIDPTTAVTTTGAAKVAGRDAYELVLTPRDTASLVGQVRLAIDAEKHVPLGVDVYAKDANDPAIRVAFQQISFEVPDAEQFTFNPPPGTKVTEPSAEDIAKEHDKAISPEAAKEAEKQAAEAGTEVVGKGWTSVLVAKLPTGDAKEGSDAAGQLDAIIGTLPKVSGSWGSGHLLTSALFSALVTDDGRILVGAVAPEKLYEAAGK